MIQFIPLLIIELLGFRPFRLLRQTNTDPKRKAELRPRRLRDQLSPGLAVPAVALLIAAIGFDLAWSGGAAQQAMAVVAANMDLAAIGMWQLYGCKLDPYQAPRDRARPTRAPLTSLWPLCCALSVFVIWQTASDANGLHYLDAPTMSLYFQSIVALSIGVVLRGSKFEDIDVDVYAIPSSPS